MSYDEELQEIIAKCRRKIAESEEVGKYDCGKDGMESKLLHEAIAEL